MKNISVRKRALLFSSIVLGWALLGFACSVDDENPLVPRRQLEASTGLAAFEAGGDAAGAPICGSYGGVEGPKAIALAILDAASADCRITRTIAKAKSEASVQCFQAFVGSKFQCPGVTFGEATSSDAGGDGGDGGAACKAALDAVLSNQDFDAFLESVASTLKAKSVSDADFAAVAPAFESARSKLVVGTVPDGKYTACAANCTVGGAACNRDTPPADSGPKDTGPKDTGPKDTGTDTGPKDAGMDAADADADAPPS